MTTENCSNDINAFGREKLAYISNEDMDDIIDSVNSYDDACSTPSRLVKLIHFDPEHPENHNLKIKDDKAYIYDGNEWIEREKNESINQLVDKAFNMIVNYYTRRKQLYIEKNSFIKEQKLDNEINLNLNDILKKIVQQEKDYYLIKFNINNAKNNMDNNLNLLKQKCDMELKIYA